MPRCGIAISSIRSISQISVHSRSVRSGFSPTRRFSRRSTRLIAPQAFATSIAPVMPASVSMRITAFSGLRSAGVPSPDPASPLRQR